MMYRLIPLLLLLGPSNGLKMTSCDVIDPLLDKLVRNNETIPCQCYHEGFHKTEPGVTIGCTALTLPAVMISLSALGDVHVGRVQLWDDVINILPQDMFHKVRTNGLSIESCGLGVIRPGALTPLGADLRHLSLRRNSLKSLDAAIFKGLKNIEKLDISMNKISSINKDVLGQFTNLQELYLNDNQLDTIEEGAFAGLKNLRKLYLNGNHLTNLTKGMLRGLEQLEELSLLGNQLHSVDWAAFSALKRLRTLDLGTNQLIEVELRGLENLQKLYLNNNSIQSLKAVKLRDLPSLVMLSLDRNSISEISDDLFGLSRSPRLESLTMAGNNISLVSPRAFAPVQNIHALALQNNHITSLSTEGQPWLRPLKRLSTLLLSGNHVKVIGGEDLPKTITTLAVDHNGLEQVDGHSFEGMSMKNLYVNDNRLAFLPKHSFDSFSSDVLQAIDLTSNTWQCVCGEEWLGQWLMEHEDQNVGDGPLGCLSLSRCPQEYGKEDNKDKFVFVEDVWTHLTRDRVSSLEEVTNFVQMGDLNFWITIMASVLAAVSVLFLIAIAFLCINSDPKHKILMKSMFNNRTDSDLHTLIGDVDPLLEPTKKSQNQSETTQKKKVHFGPET